MLFEDIREKTYGTQFRDTIYDDLEGVSAVISLPDDAPHRNVDKIVLKVGTDHADRAKTAIVCPPTIYGPGRGPDNQRSHQLPELCRVTIERGQSIKVNEGKTYWTHIHVHDLSDLYLKLVEEAAAGGSTREWPDKPSTWGAEGYYFAENGEHVWGEVSQWVASEAKKQKLASTEEVKSVSPEDAGRATAFGQALWGANSRCRAKRARSILNWKPSGGSFKDEVKRALEWEAKELGTNPGHAKKAAEGNNR